MIPPNRAPDETNGAGPQRNPPRGNGKPPPARRQEKGPGLRPRAQDVRIASRPYSENSSLPPALRARPETQFQSSGPAGPVLTLPPGIPSSLPWLYGLIGASLLIHVVEFLYLLAYPSPGLPPLILGLPLVGIVTGVTAAGWLRHRHRYLVELGSLADQRSSDPRVAVPFPVRTDDETGFLATSLNAMTVQFRQTLAGSDGRASQLERILTSIDAGIVLADAAGRIVFVNPAAERLLDRSSAVLLGRTVLESTLHTALSQAVENATMHGEAASLPLYPDHSRRQALAQVSPAGACFTGAVIVLQDQEEQARLDSVRRDFTANVSHELRTPLASIRAMAETLLSGAREEPEMAEMFLTIIVKETERLAHLTDDILDLARYEAGRLERSPLDLSALLGDVLLQVEPKILQAGLELQSSLEPLPPILGDRSALQQVFLNLLDNAVKYTHAGKITLCAATCGDEKPANGTTPGAWVMVEVADTGSGIPAEDVHRIFERFYRVDKGRSREMGGTGLGLSIARHVTEAHGGRIEVSSEPGQGTVFRVWLPR